MNTDLQRAVRYALPLLVTALGGCVYDRYVLAPAGDAATPLAVLGWPVLIFFTGVSIVMWGLLAWLAVRRTGTLEEHAPVDSKGGGGWILVGGFLIPVVSFAVIFTMTLRTLAAVPMTPPDRPADIRVIGHQWWWEVQYLFGDLPQHVTSANEIHIPVGVAVEVDLQSADVIHSLWIPRLGGKVDLIPGQTTHMHMEADAEGNYPGGCAELCGTQHANMKIVVVAQQPPEFERWLASEREPGAAPQDAAEINGQRIFLHRACVACHTVRGTSARATVGPDLTHIGSRHTIGASLPNDTAILHAWIVNAPSLKPGARMPALPEFRGEELHDLVSYLQHLR